MSADRSRGPRRVPGAWLDHLLLAAMLLPNLVKVWLDRSMWVSDTAGYGFDALRLDHARATMSIGEWWQAMVGIEPKPPMLVWIAHLLVPLGRAIARIEPVLLLANVAFLGVALLLLYRAVRILFGRRDLALVACLALAATPLASDTVTRLYVQPLQLLGVAWFVYIAAASRRWDSAFTLLQLVAASAFGVLTMMSSPSMCFVPGVVALVHAWRGRSGGWRRTLTRRHAVVAAAAVALVFAALSWYLTNLDSALAYARHAFVYLYAGTGATEFVDKLMVWFGRMKAGYLAAPTLDLTWPLAALAVAGTLCGLARLRRWREEHTLLAAAFAAQVVVALCVFATSAQQTYRYPLGLLPYVAVVLAWCLHQVRSRWVVSITALLLLAQFAVLKTAHLGIGAWHDRWRLQPLRTEPDPRVEWILAADAALAATRPHYVVMGTGGLGFYSSQLRYYAARSNGWLERPRTYYHDIEFMLTDEQVGADPDKAWQRLVENPPTVVVLAANEAVDPDFRHARGGWGIMTRASLALARRIRTSGRFEQLPLLDDQPVLEVWRWRGE